jgi:hypothetical protein
VGVEGSKPTARPSQRGGVHLVDLDVGALAPAWIEPPARVVQVDRDERRAPPIDRPALPLPGCKRSGSPGDWQQS